MANKEIFVYRVEYEKLATMSAWTTFIAAHSMEEAERYIMKIVGPIRVTSAGMHSRLDSVSFEVRDRIVNAFMGKTAKIADIALEDDVKKSSSKLPVKKKK